MDIFNYDTILSLLTLTGLEIVLGIDNVIFIALIVQNLEKNSRKKARFIGLSLALVIRILMLFFATWIMKLTHPLFTIFSFPISGRSLMLIFGGLFLIVKTIMEFIEMFSNEQHEKKQNETKSYSFSNAIIQIIFIDIILSFDSIITAVGLSDNLSVIVIAVVIAMLVMLASASTIGNFIYSNPSIKVLALAFVGLVGVMLFLNGFDIVFNKGYLYFAMFFSLMIEVLNSKLKNR